MPQTVRSHYHRLAIYDLVTAMWLCRDNKVLNPRLAPNWFTNVKVIEIAPDLGVSGTGPLH